MGVCKTSTRVLSSPNGIHRFLAVLIWPLSTNRSMRVRVAKSSYSLSSQAAFMWRSAKCTFPLQWLHLSYFICTCNIARFPLPGSPVVAQQGGSDSALLDLEQGRVLIVPWASPVLFLQHVVSVAFDLQSATACNGEFVAGSAGYKRALYLCAEHPLQNCLQLQGARLCNLGDTVVFWCLSAELCVSLNWSGLSPELKPWK